MKKRKTLKEQAKNLKHPGKQTKKDLDNWLDTNVNQPLAKRGYETLGAGLSAAGSTAGDWFIPENEAEAAAASAPGGAVLGKIGKLLGLGGKKASKAKKLVDDVNDTKEKASKAMFGDLVVPPSGLKKRKPVGAKMRGERVNPEASDAFKKADKADEAKKQKKRTSGITVDYSKMK